MKKTNMAKKGLMPAVLGAVCSVVALTSVSYAWFTIGNSGTLDSIDVNVSAADGMQISVDAYDWKSHLTLEDLNKAGTIPTNEIMPVSTNGAINNGALTMYKGSLDKDGTTVLADSNSSGNYVMLDLYIKVDNNKTLKLAKDSDVKNKKIGEKASEVHYASRVAFIDLGSKADAGTALEQLNGTGVTGNAFIWEPNADVHTAQAVYQSKGTLEATNSIVANYQGIKGIKENTTNEADFSTVTPSLQTNKGVGVESDAALFQLEAGVNKIRIYIWLEGQDADCLNDVSGSAFSTSLGFTIADPVQA